MIRKVNDVLAGIPMTCVAGIALLASLILGALQVNTAIDLAWIAVFICGIPLLYLSVWRIIHNPGISKMSSALLITVAMVAAIRIGDLFAAGEVGFIMSIGAILEDKTTQRAQKGLKKQLARTPTYGRRILDGVEEQIPAEAIRIGDVLRVLPGETFPVDGEIIHGTTSIDQSIMTGESLPVDKEVGEAVFCGTINCFGTVDLKATKVGEDRSLQKLIRLVEEAGRKQAPMQRIADQAASYLVPVALLIAIVGFFVTKDIVRAVTILVVFCPCALVLATPTAIMAAIGQATKHGVMIKSGEALERMGKVDLIAFDKTGTLTQGNLKVSDVISFRDRVGAEELLCLAASAESLSEHPLAKAIVAHAKEKKLLLKEATEFQMHPGLGIRAKVGERHLLCGSEKYLVQNGVAILPDVRISLETLLGEGKAAVLVAVDGVCGGILVLSDTLRPTAVSVVAA